MIGWLMVLSFLLGFACMWFAMVRTVTRTAAPIGSARLGESAVHIADDDDAVDDDDADELDERPARTPVRSGARVDVPHWKHEDDEVLFDEG